MNGRIKLGYALDKALDARRSTAFGPQEQSVFAVGFVFGYYGYDMGLPKQTAGREWPDLWGEGYSEGKAVNEQP